MSFQPVSLCWPCMQVDGLLLFLSPHPPFHITENYITASLHTTTHQRSMAVPNKRHEGHCFRIVQPNDNQSTRSNPDTVTSSHHLSFTHADNDVENIYFSTLLNLTAQAHLCTSHFVVLSLMLLYVSWT